MTILQGEFVYVLNAAGERQTHLGKAYVIGNSLLSPGKILLKFPSGHICGVSEEQIERIWRNDWGRFASPCDT